MNPLKLILAVSLFVISIQAFSQTLSVTVQPNTSCGAPNGAASATVDGTTVGYSFRWFAGLDITGTLLSTSANVSGLGAGHYTVEATQSSTGEVIGVTIAEIADVTSLPVVTIQVLSNVTSCALPNGSLRANVPDAVSNYTFQWYAGAAFSGPVISTTRTASQLQAGAYAVVVTHNVSLCQTVMNATVVDQLVIPSGTIQVLSHQTSCNTPNGSLRAFVSGSPSAHTFRWFRGTSATGLVLGSSQTLSNLQADTYTVKITNKTTQCSNTVTATVLDQTVIANAAVQVYNVTSCSTPDGFAWVTGLASFNDFTYSWYEGAVASGPVLSIEPGLQYALPGTYTVAIQHKFSSCLKALTATIADERVLPVVTSQTTPNTSCSIPNGTVSATVDDPFAHTIHWYEGVDILTGQFLGTGASLQNLSGGIYTAQVINNASGCATVLSAIVSEETVAPDVSLAVTNVTSCQSGLGQIDAVTPDAQANYTFQWFEGPNTWSGPVISTVPTLSAPAGLYTVLVRHKSTDCEVTVTSQIADARVIPVVTVQVTNQTSCEIPDGLLIAEVAGEPVYDFNFEWYEGPVPYIGPLLSVSNHLTNVAAGIYTVVVTHYITGCQTVMSAQVSQECSMFSATSAGSDPVVTFYPNPTDDELHVATGARNGSVSLINREGRTIGSHSGEKEMIFDLSDEPAGVYILKYTTGRITKRYRIVRR
jgi:large repetitive protein